MHAQPESFLDRLHRVSSPAQPAAASTVTTRATGGGPRVERWARAVLDGCRADMLTVPIGSGRNDALNRAALRSYRAFLAAGLVLDDVTRILGDADGGLDHPATRRTLQSARDAAERQGPADDAPSDNETPPWERSDDPFAPQHQPPSTGDAAPVGAPGVPPRVDWHTLWTEPVDDTWILDPIIPARRLVAIYSEPKLGKSLLMLEIAVGIARGVRVLGAKPEPCRVLYVDHENDPRGDIRARLQAMGHGPEHLDQLDYLSFPAMSKLDQPAGGVELLAAAEHYRSGLVVIDTVSRAVAGEENANDTWLNWYRNTGVLLKRAGITVVRLDHPGKDAEKGMRGASAKLGDVDLVWRMTSAGPDLFRLQATHARMRLAEDDLTLRRVDDPLRHIIEPRGRAVRFDAKVEQIIAAADAADLPRDAGRPAVADAAKAAGVTARNETYAEATRRRQNDVHRPATSVGLSPTGGDSPTPQDQSLRGQSAGQFAS